MSTETPDEFAFRSSVYDLRINLLRNVNYCNLRRRFFRLSHRLAQAFSIFMSCGAVALLLSGLPSWAASLTSVFAAAVICIDMAFDPRGSEIEYQKIEVLYHEVLEKLDSCERRGELDSNSLHELCDEYGSFHKIEPPVNVTVDLLARNEAIYQLSGNDLEYCKQHVIQLGWWERTFANIIDFRRTQNQPQV